MVEPTKGAGSNFDGERTEKRGEWRRVRYSFVLGLNVKDRIVDLCHAFARNTV